MDAHCMSCKKAWGHDMLIERFPKSFLSGEWKKRREEVLFDREKSLLPATQPFVETERFLEKYTEEVRQLRARIRTLVDELSHGYVPYDISIEEWERHQRILVQYRNERDACKNELDFYLDLISRVRHGAHRGHERKQCVRGCPAEGCRGFLSTQWKCGLCEVWVCPDCHEIKGDHRDAHHTCKPENVETARLLAKDSKPCPSCATMIFKVEGCDQMFCTQCHTAFGWKTGRIETGVIHNPHYYEYLRQRNGGHAPRNAMDVPCGGPPDPYSMRVHLTHQRIPKITIQRICELVRSTTHNQQVVLPRYETDLVEGNRDIRIKYMMNRLDEPRFKQLLQQREKARQKNQSIHMVLQMYVSTMTDILQRVQATETLPAIEAILDEIPALREYVGSMLQKVATSFQCVVPTIDPLAGTVVR
jgi:hypothetical protein